MRQPHRILAIIAAVLVAIALLSVILWLAWGSPRPAGQAKLAHGKMVTDPNPKHWGLARISSKKWKPPASEDESWGPFTYPASAGEGVVVYVLDTGITISHDDLKGRGTEGVVACLRQTVGDAPPKEEEAAALSDHKVCYNAADNHGHGTTVAGFAVGSTYGVARNATVVNVKLMDAFWPITVRDLTRALNWITNDVKRHKRRAVLDMSFGWGTAAKESELKQVRELVEAVVDEGLPVVVAASNNRDEPACSDAPAGSPKVITVSSIDKSNRRSGAGDKCVDLYAPGNDLVGISNKGGSATRDNVSGTSFATPMVTGAVALLLAENPHMTPAEVKATLMETASVAETESVDGVKDDFPKRVLYVGG